MIEKIFETLPLRELVPYENNPRLNDEAVEDVMESIRQCENLDPIEIDEENIILAGHTRLKALERMGYEETEVLRYIGLTEEQKRKYRLLSNKTGEKAMWDFSKLEEELEDLDFGDFDFGFEEFDTMEEVPEIEEDEVPEEPTDQRVQYGEIWKLGNHRLICGDSTDPETVKRLMGEKEADLLIPSLLPHPPFPPLSLLRPPPALSPLPLTDAPASCPAHTPR